MAEASFTQVCKQILELKASVESLNEKSSELKGNFESSLKKFDSSLKENETLKASIIAEMLNVNVLKNEVEKTLNALESSKETIALHEQKIAEAMNLSKSASQSINNASEQIANALDVTKEAVELFVSLGAELKDIVGGARSDLENYSEPIRDELVSIAAHLKDELASIASYLKDELRASLDENLSTQNAQIAVVNDSIQKARDIALSLDNLTYRYERDYELLGYKWDRVALNLAVLEAMLAKTQIQL